MENVTATTVRRKDTTKGPPLRILCLDGGGVRGYSMLIILQELMYRAYVESEGTAPRRDQIPKPCDHFDLIAGAGTGGLIALMLGRLRLDIETCKNIYPRLTKYVFETDKTIAGIPYRSTLFKASRLEQAIRQCVREYTVSESEGNDGSSPSLSGSNYMDTALSCPSSTSVASALPPKRLSRSSAHLSRTLSTSSGQLSPSPPLLSPTMTKKIGRKRTPRNGPATLLRSYDSRKEPPPDFNCTIWQAGRATGAMLHHFKPIQIGQQVFLDEGGGKFNPSPQILDEATVNEWPGRDVGIFVSVGTGKRPSGTSNRTHEWWEDVFVEFAEARRNLISKIEGCETIHQYMLKEHLAKRNVPKENYCRLNVEIGVGEYGMNEWNRLAEISTNTRIYLAKNEVQRMTHDAAVKLARIHRTHRRIEAHAAAIAAAEARETTLMMRPLPPPPPPPQRPIPSIPSHPPQISPNQSPTTLRRPSHPSHTQPVYELPAIELPADPTPISQFTAPPSQPKNPSRLSHISVSPPGSRHSMDQSHTSSPRVSSDTFISDAAPPRPPKTPMPQAARPVNTVNNTTPNNDISENVIISMPSPTQGASRPIGTTAPNSNKWKPPYPDDGPPPPVNKFRKPTSNSRG
ncbi:Patatin-like phospholipase family protein [Coccidioides posadasii C735 delta SOWgp]|uniref:Patatin-like phospholipase family protein n=1 Tax=Coccidioides posadasii (strain C735) TaxID=222929 RepID=C5PHP8_COCP7|nr:Patatin-like phospholipase family protein [Coccidioides posadasii C735 delta SOWgp]EER24051.1 Patatin-like phospholipase family protein [Coccidioides posadasii C735 delta SOWgp]|eukprot:XP_003066196.1 Patatin-like phospholipase family protein [Coccidioides posadasii C735 delta SOWgp]